MSSYSALSAYYDRLMNEFPYDRYAEYVLGFVSSGKGADFFCGSGKMTLLFALAGIKMIGVDSSAEMLNEAEKNSAKRGVKIPYLLSDAQNADIGKHFDLVTAVCDGVNYLSPKATEKFFHNVAGCLNKGGKFFFDISSAYKLEKILGNNMFYEDYDDITYFWKNRLGKNYVDMDLTFFKKAKDGSYSREDEKHKQYIHSAENIEKMLKASGLTLRSKLDGVTFGKLKPTSERIIFFAEKE